MVKLNFSDFKIITLKPYVTNFNHGYVMYVKPDLEMPKNTERQEQISHNSVPDTFRSLP